MTFARSLAALGLASTAALASAQYIFWKPTPGHKPFTAIYGEIQVIVDNPGVYFCGCNWWPSQKPGGYAGIQDLKDKGKRVIFSIWDTSPELHPQVVATDPRVKTSDFKNEGSGAHSHLPYDWEFGHTFQFYVTKRLDQSGQNVFVTMYFYDEGQRRWLGEGRILSPLGISKTADSFGGMLSSFLENLRSKEDKQYEAPKLALFKLWGGTGPDDLTPITSAMGKKKWGTMNDAFFLAEGDDLALQQIMKASLFRGQSVQFGEEKKALTIRAQSIPPEVLKALRTLP